MAKKTSIEKHIGKKFGKLTIVSFAKRNVSYTYYNCKCDCGNTCVVGYANLSRHITTDCGCMRYEKHPDYVRFMNEVLTCVSELELEEREAAEGIELIRDRKQVSLEKAKDLYYRWRKVYAKTCLAF